eukprot:9295_1
MTIIHLANRRLLYMMIMFVICSSTVLIFCHNFNLLTNDTKRNSPVLQLVMLPNDNPTTQSGKLSWILSSIVSPSNQIAPQVSSDTSESKRLAQKRDVGDIVYGGGGIDPKHLGGFLHNDTKSYERELWEYIIPRYNITSVLDIGCGMGVSTLFFASKIRKYIEWNNVLCIEGSHDAIQHSWVKNITIQHDYSLGPFWPSKVYDLAWSIEFLEHVNASFMDNYMATFKKAKLLLVSASPTGGWSHLNIQKKEYWIEKFESYGFIYDHALTKTCREKCPIFPVFSNWTWHDLEDCKWGNKTKRTSYFHHNGLAFWNSYFYPNISMENVDKFRHLTLIDKLILYPL